MSQPLRFTCSSCGDVHEGLPDVGYQAPVHYFDVPEDERDSRARLRGDFCVIDDEFYFIRTVLLVPVQDTADDFGWGVWSSLSEQNFHRYVDLYDSGSVTGEGPYFGWLSNELPLYPDTLNLKVRVHLQDGGMRPLLELEPTDHPLAVDQRDGIAHDRAVQMAGELLHLFGD